MYNYLSYLKFSWSSRFGRTVLYLLQAIQTCQKFFEIPIGRWTINRISPLQDHRWFQQVIQLTALNQASYNYVIFVVRWLKKWLHHTCTVANGAIDRHSLWASKTRRTELTSRRWMPRLSDKGPQGFCPWPEDWWMGNKPPSMISPGRSKRTACFSDTDRRVKIRRCSSGNIFLTICEASLHPVFQTFFLTILKQMIGICHSHVT